MAISGYKSNSTGRLKSGARFFLSLIAILLVGGVGVCIIRFNGLSPLDYQYSMAEQCMADGYYSEAVSSLDNVIKSSPATVKARIVKACAYLKSDDSRNASATIDEIIDIIAVHSETDYTDKSGGEFVFENDGYNLRQLIEWQLQKNYSEKKIDRNNEITSMISNNDWNLYSKPEAPSINEPSGAYNKLLKITVSGSGRLYYTLDGTLPDIDSEEFTKEIKIAKNGKTVVKAVAVDEMGVQSEVTECEYDVTLPELKSARASVKSGEYPVGTAVTLVNPNEYGSVYYTLNGKNPTLKSNKYTTPIKLEEGKLTVTAAVISDDGLTVSKPAKFTYSAYAVQEGMYLVRQNAKLLNEPKVGGDYNMIVRKNNTVKVLEQVVGVDGVKFSYVEFDGKKGYIKSTILKALQ